MQDQVNGAAVPLRGRIRLLRHSELPQFKAHLLRLDADSRRDRFNGPTSDSFVASYAERCFNDGTIVIGYVDGGEVLGAAELHGRPEDAEPTGAIAFRAELRGGARASGYERLLVPPPPQNEPMKRLARSFNAKLRFDHGETVGLIELEPVPPLPARPGVGLLSLGAAVLA